MSRKRAFACLGLLLNAFVLVSFLWAAQSPELSVPSEGFGFLPANGTTVTINPPCFVWVPHPKAAHYVLQVQRQDAPSSSAKEFVSRFALFTPEKTFESGAYAWRFRVAFDENGTSLSAWSQPRHFIVPASVPEFPRPSYSTVHSSVPTRHPRLLVRAEQLAALRRTRATHRHWFELLEKEANKLLNEPLPQEPRPWSGGRWNAQEWLQYYREIVRAAHCTETLAFAALVTGSPQYAQAAKKWLLHLSSWDPSGTTSLRVNDEQTMHIMFSCAHAYTWLHDQLHTDEQTRVREMLRVRAQEAYRHLRRQEAPYEQCPYNSHNGRLWHFLGEVAIALYGELPEATEWLDYAITIYYGWYPIWGASDGGWAEGLHYFLSYHEFVFHWLWQLEKVMSIPAARKPFYSHCGDFLLAVAPPGSPLSGFGDFSENPPSPRRAWIAAMLAEFTANAQCAWLAEKVGLTPEGISPLRYLAATSQSPPSRPPGISPRLRCFPETGLAAYHSNLLDSGRDVQWLLRASPFGNLSHSHCDQLGLVMGAFGDPVFVNTGFRDYFDSPFCRDWYWHTRAHNAVLIAGQGQRRSPAAKSQILSSGESGELAWSWADATPAYLGLATRVRRGVASLDCGDSAIVCVLDDIESTRPTVEVMWHTRVQPHLRCEARTFDLSTTHARVLARIFSNAELHLAITDRYSTEPAFYPDWIPPTRHEWHLTVSAQASPARVGAGHLIQVLNVFEIVPRSASPRLSHLLVPKWGQKVTVQWQSWEQKRPVYAELIFDSQRADVAYKTAVKPPASRDSGQLEACAHEDSRLLCRDFF
ncbi:MAG: DUF4962 domain-containing protein [Candidatus Sumerlaeaceae bacterium]